MNALSTTRATACALVLFAFAAGCREGGGFDYWDSGFHDTGPDIPMDTLDPVDVGPNVELPPPGVRAVQVAAGTHHVCALGDDGSVYCWGDNVLGQTAAETLTDQLAPSRVNGLPPIASIHASHLHTCAMDREGGVWCWGGNGSQQLGVRDLGTECRCSAVPLRIDVPPAAAVFIAERGACSRDVSGAIHHWSQDFVVLRTPADELTGAEDIDFGLTHGCALTDGAVRCFGNRGFGRAGAREDGVIEVANVVEVGVGGAHTCVLDASGRVLCWGEARGSALGSPEGGVVTYCVDDSNSGSQCSVTPSSPEALPLSRALSVGKERSCVITTANTVYCWGSWFIDAPGFNAWQTTNDAPALVPGVDDAVSIATGGSVACMIDGEGAVYCWGWGGHGQLGNGRMNDDIFREPLRVLGFGDASTSR